MKHFNLNPEESEMEELMIQKKNIKENQKNKYIKNEQKIEQRKQRQRRNMSLEMQIINSLDQGELK